MVRYQNRWWLSTNYKEQWALVRVVSGLFRVAKSCPTEGEPKKIFFHLLFVLGFEFQKIYMLRKMVGCPSCFGISHCFIAILQLTPGRLCARVCVAGTLYLALPCGWKEAWGSTPKCPVSSECAVLLPGEVQGPTLAWQSWLHRCLLETVLVCLPSSSRSEMGCWLLWSRETCSSKSWH